MEGSSAVFLLFGVILVLALVVLLIIYWIFKLQRNRGFIILEISAGQPDRLLTIRVEPDRAQQMLDRLLDRVLLHSEPEEGPGGDPRPEPVEECGSEGETGPEVSTEAPPPSRDGNQTNNLGSQDSDASHHASLSSSGSCHRL